MSKFIYSIIIPHYKSSGLLQRMLKSTPELTQKNHQV